MVKSNIFNISLPDDAFPKEPEEFCKICRIMLRRRHSWFCGDNCEDIWLRDYFHRGLMDYVIFESNRTLMRLL